MFSFLRKSRSICMQQNVTTKLTILPLKIVRQDRLRSNKYVCVNFATNITTSTRCSVDDSQAEHSRISCSTQLVDGTNTDRKHSTRFTHEDITRSSNASARSYASNRSRWSSTTAHDGFLQPRHVRNQNTARASVNVSLGNLVPVEAIHIAEKIDMIQLLASASFGQQRTTSKKKLYGNKHLSYGVFQLDSTETGISPQDAISSLSSNNASSVDTAKNSQQFVAVFPFGSVVFFNVPSNEISVLVTQIKKFASEPTISGYERKEKYNVLIQEEIDTVEDEIDKNFIDQSVESADGSQLPNVLEEKRDVTPDYCIVRNQLDMNGVAVISNIMAQTVALDTYSDTVDELLAKFAAINSTVKRTGKFTPTDRNFLFKTVAQNNSIFIDMISKTRIKDRSDTAWTLTKYETIHYGLKNEFEIDDRFENIEFKLNLIQQNAKFFMEVLHHKSSNELELVIVVLILAECILMMIEMSGNGGRFFAFLSSILPSAVTTKTTILSASPDVTDIVHSATSADIGTKRR